MVETKTLYTHAIIIFNCSRFYYITRSVIASLVFFNAFMLYSLRRSIVLSINKIFPLKMSIKNFFKKVQKEDSDLKNNEQKNFVEELFSNLKGIHLLPF